ncbi:hypothetical protein ACQQ2N_07130 [Dokdonella sp. MW10]|uniref:hypothetical protein n=1 Tax=Dokdonella sp. MW10 TaxID=2992926 RepID=UPI003F8075DC
MLKVVALVAYALGATSGNGDWHACPLPGETSSCISRPDAPCMSPGQAIAIAMSDARRLGIDVTSYAPPEVNHGCSGALCVWAVHFRGRSLAIGDHFGMLVDDTDCTTTLQPGL